MSVTAQTVPGGLIVLVVDWWREAPQGTTRPVFLRKELPKLAKAGPETWAAVVLVKQAIPGTVVSIHYTRADIARIMRARACRANRFSWGSTPRPFGPLEDDDA